MLLGGLSMRRLRKRRMRRTPEAARDEILAAAERVFTDALPDSVGLKDVAREAGVSHPLVSHYFGTYEGLVDATLERRLLKLREDLTGEFVQLLLGNASGFELLRAHRRLVAVVAGDRVTSRLAMWAMMTRRFEKRSIPPTMAALRLIADAVEMRGGLDVSREDLEFALVAEAAMTITWTYAKTFIAQALSREVTPELDAAMDEKTAEMIELFIRAKKRGKK